MGIVNINIITQPHAVNPAQERLVQQAEAAREERLINDHRRGNHPWGSMRRDCPYCQAGK